MADADTIRTRIEQIDAILLEGVSRTTIGDRTVQYDLAALQAERDDLRRRLVAASSRSSFRRAVFKNA